MQASGSWLKILPNSLGPGWESRGHALSHHGNGGSAYPENRGIGIPDANSNGKSGRKVNPVECAFDIGQARRHFAVFGENAITDTFHNPIEPAVRMSHQIHVDRSAGVNGF